MYAGYVFKRNCPISPPAMQKVYSVLWGTMMVDYDSEEESKTSLTPRLAVEILGVAEWDGVGRANQYANGFLVVTHTGGTYYIATPSTKERDEWILQVKQALECNFANSDINPFKPSKMVQPVPDKILAPTCPISKLPLQHPLPNAQYCRSCGRGFSSAEYVKELCTMLPLGNEESELCCIDCKNSQSLVYWLKMMNYNNGMILHNHSPTILCDINRFKATFKITRRTSKQLDTAAQLWENGSIDVDEFRELVTLNVAVNNEIMSQDSLKLREALDAIGDDMQMVLTILMSSTTAERGGRSSYFQVIDKLLYLADSQPLLIDFYWPQLLQVHLLESSNRTISGLQRLDLLQQALLAISQRYPSLASRMAWSLMATVSDFLDKKGNVTPVQFASCLSLLFQLDFAETGSVSAIADVPMCHRLSNVIGASGYQQTEIGLELSILFLARNRLQEVFDKETREMAKLRLAKVGLVGRNIISTSNSESVSSSSSSSISSSPTQKFNSNDSGEASNLIVAANSPYQVGVNNSDNFSDSSNRENGNFAGSDTRMFSLTCNQLFYGMGVITRSKSGSLMTSPRSAGSRRSCDEWTGDGSPSLNSSDDAFPPSFLTTLWPGFSSQVDFIHYLTEMVDALRFVDRPIRTETFVRDVAVLGAAEKSDGDRESRTGSLASSLLSGSNSSIELGSVGLVSSNLASNGGGESDGAPPVVSVLPTQLPIPPLGWDTVSCYAGEPIYRINKIFAEECRVFRTKARAPSLIICEVKRDDSSLLTNPFLATIKKQAGRVDGYDSNSNSKTSSPNRDSSNINGESSNFQDVARSINDSSLYSSSEEISSGGIHLVNTNHIHSIIRKRSISVGHELTSHSNDEEHSDEGLSTAANADGSVDLSKSSAEVCGSPRGYSERVAISFDVEEVDSIVNLGMDQFIATMQKNRAMSADYDNQCSGTIIEQELSLATNSVVDGIEVDAPAVASDLLRKESAGEGADSITENDEQSNSIISSKVVEESRSNNSSNSSPIIGSNNNNLSLRLKNPNASSPVATPTSPNSFVSPGSSPISNTSPAASGDASNTIAHNLRRRRSWVTTKSSSNKGSLASLSQQGSPSSGSSNFFPSTTSISNNYSSGQSPNNLNQTQLSSIVQQINSDKLQTTSTRRQSFLASNQKSNSFFSSLVAVTSEDLKSLSVSVSGVTLNAPSTDINPSILEDTGSALERNSILSSLSECNSIAIPTNVDSGNSLCNAPGGGMLLDVEGDLEDIVVAPTYTEGPADRPIDTLHISGWTNVTRKVLFSAQKLLLSKKIDVREYNSLINSDSKYRDAWNKEVDSLTKSKVETAFGECWKDKRLRLLGDKAYSNKDIIVYESTNINGNDQATVPEWDFISSVQSHRAVARIWPQYDLRCFIVKSNDDLRQEILCLQLMQLCHDIFQDVRLDHLLWLKPYSIICTGSSTGLVEVIPDTMSIDSLKKTEGFVSLSNYFKLTYAATPDKLATAKRNLASSLAAYSLFCYVFAVKDRHNGNILLDAEGHIIHIDFGFILSIAPGGSFSLESAPFKLTEEVVDTLGGLTSSYFGEFIKAFTLGFLALRSHMSTILGLVEVISSQSPFPCFAGKDAASVVDKLRQRLRGDLSVKDCVKHCMDLIALSYAAYGSKQYDSFQWYSNGISP